MTSRIITVLAILCNISHVLAQQTASEKAAWEQEQAYWRYVESGDQTGFRTIWADDFIGWPSSEPKPVDVSKLCFTLNYHLSTLNFLITTASGWLDRLVGPDSN